MQATFLSEENGGVYIHHVKEDEFNKWVKLMDAEIQDFGDFKSICFKVGNVSITLFTV